MKGIRETRLPPKERKRIELRFEGYREQGKYCVRCELLPGVVACSPEVDEDLYEAGKSVTPEFTFAALRYSAQMAMAKTLRDLADLFEADAERDT